MISVKNIKFVLTGTHITKSDLTAILDRYAQDNDTITEISLTEHPGDTSDSKSAIELIIGLERATQPQDLTDVSYDVCIDFGE